MTGFRLMSYISTPQPFRNLATELNRTRNSWESEMWDDNSDMIFVAEDDVLLFHNHVACRAWITAQADTDTIGTFTILVDGNINRVVNVIVTQTAQCHTYADLEPGDHTITLAATGTLTDPLIMVRRGVRS